MSASGLYTIDGFDLFDSFGFAVQSGSDEIIQFPESDEVYSYTWKSEGITQYDLTSRNFLDKDVTISGHIIATNKLDFWRKYKALWTLLKQPGERTLHSFELEQTFKVFYKKTSGTQRFGRLQGYPDKIAVSINVIFRALWNDFAVPTGKLNQVISFPLLPSKSVGDPDFYPGATATSGLEVIYLTSDAGIVEILDGKIHIVGEGSVLITALQNGNDDFFAALPVSRYLIISSETARIFTKQFTNQFL